MMNSENKIKALRKEKKLAMREFAKEIGVSLTFLFDLEKGNRIPNDSVMGRILEAADEKQRKQLADWYAELKDDIPVDVKVFLKDNPEEVEAIRKKSEKAKRNAYMIRKGEKHG